jgi:hypothetical protein
MPTTKMDDPYIYGPVTQEEFESLAVNHRMTRVNNEIFIGVPIALEQFADRLISNPTPPAPTEE